METNWNEIFKRVKKDQAEREFTKIHGPRQYKTVKLKPDEWYTCRVCNGTCSYEESADAHRSAGIVPCYHCVGGLVRTKTVEIPRKVRVKAGSKKVD